MPGPIHDLDKYFSDLEKSDHKKYDERILDAQKVVTAISTDMDKDKLGDLIFQIKQKYLGIGLKESKFNKILDSIFNADPKLLKTELQDKDILKFNKPFTFDDIFSQEEQKWQKELDDYINRENQKGIKSKVRTVFSNPQLSNMKHAIAVNLNRDLINPGLSATDKIKIIDKALTKSEQARGPEKPSDLDALLEKGKKLLEQKIALQESRQDLPTPRKA